MRIERLGFVKGVSPSQDPSVVHPQALWEGHNVRIDESGILRIRRGFDVTTESLGLGPVQGMVSAFGTIIMASVGVLQRLNADNSLTAIVGDKLTTSDVAPVEFVRWASSGAEVVYVFAGSGIYETDGTDLGLVTPYAPIEGEPANLIRKEDGSQDTDSGPARSRLVVLKASVGQRLVMAGDPESPNRVYFSAPLKANYWPEDQIVQLPDDGGTIVALANWYNTLLIFRDRDIWAFIGTSATDAGAALVLQSTAVGCIASRSVADVPGVGLVFLGNDNVYALQGVSGIENRAQVVPLADDVRRLITRAVATGTTGVCAIYRDREYWLCFPGSQYEERVFRLSLQSSAGWFTDSGPRISYVLHHAGRFFGGLWLEQRLVTLGDNLYDDAAPITMDMAFRREGLGFGPSRIKRLLLYVPSKVRLTDEGLYWLGSEFNAQVLNEGDTETATMFANTAQHFDVRLLVEGQEFVVKDLRVIAEQNQAAAMQGYEFVSVLEARFHPSLLGHFVQLRISARVPGEDLALLGYVIEFEPRQTQRGKDV